MKKILAIGGAVMKTEARKYLWDVADDIEMLLVNGGALFHDFQNVSMEHIEYTCGFVARHIAYNAKAPAGSFINVMRDYGKPVLLFTGLGCDYWQKYLIGWERLAKRVERDFNMLCTRFRSEPFHFINMCSAVIMPEVFQKAIQGVAESYIKADVVDFLDMYRPRTRVAKYGEYYQMDVVEYMKKWSKAYSEELAPQETA
jgi:hypothetical protein